MGRPPFLIRRGSARPVGLTGRARDQRLHRIDEDRDPNRAHRRHTQQHDPVDRPADIAKARAGDALHEEHRRHRAHRHEELRGQKLARRQMPVADQHEEIGRRHHGCHRDHRPEQTAPEDFLEDRDQGFQCHILHRVSPQALPRSIAL